MSKYIALCISDLHISAAPPISRAVGATEEERRKRWRRAMARQLAQLHKLSAENGNIPIIIPGDIWDSCTQPHSIVNWLIRHIPPGITWYGISGNHDQPNHQLSRLMESPYWTLVETGKLVDIKPGVPLDIPGATPIRLHGFPHGVPIKPLRKEATSGLVIDIAVVHQYVWSSRNEAYPDAPKSNHICRLKSNGYDVVVIGDNHHTFDVMIGKQLHHNCGCFLRRTEDERSHKPSVGLLRADGTIKRHYLDVSKDKWNDDREPKVESNGKQVDVSGLVSEIRTSQEAISYSEAVTRFLRKNAVSEGARQDITEAMEKKNG